MLAKSFAWAFTTDGNETFIPKLIIWNRGLYYLPKRGNYII